ncbi:MAG: hypothetical protein AAGA46_13055 [Cyanobacteria bacterium P01_F01_bin.13]
MDNLLPVDAHTLITNLAGWIPAVILPTATISQLLKIVRSKSAEGVSLSTWLLFGIANVGLYIFTEKYFTLQALIGLLGTAIMDFIIVAMIVLVRGNKDFKAEDIKLDEVA